MMNRTIKLFQWLLKDYSLFLKKRQIQSGQVMLIMDGLEGFSEKVESHIPIGRCSSFRKYRGASVYEECRDFVANKFQTFCVYSNITLSVHYFDRSNGMDSVQMEEFVKVITNGM